ADKKAADKKAADKKAAEQKVAQELAEVEQALNDLLDDEDAQMQALEQEATNSQAVASAVNYIRNEIIQRWVRPANARTGMVVELVIHLVPTGEVVDIEIRYQDDSATDAFVASAVKAVRKVGRFDKLSQLKAGLFDANFREFNFLFKPEDLRL
ncbi:MAG: TonB C-terminal domain-containing protein, partial [Oceanospirillaceae bacterium]|nr:TonB C-terminal domain-containing protein [Oceanospirillaceae bacterium]